MCSIAFIVLFVSVFCGCCTYCITFRAFVFLPHLLHPHLPLSLYNKLMCSEAPCQRLFSDNKTFNLGIVGSLESLGNDAMFALRTNFNISTPPFPSPPTLVPSSLPPHTPLNPPVFTPPRVNFVVQPGGPLRSACSC